MAKKKLFNDPVYGFVNYPWGIIYDIIDHPYFQRLRRISQLGMTHYVYPGARHTRFHHALGALHLMNVSIETLKSKGIEISDEEAEGVSIAILLHDIGHGPFSHALENSIIDIHHEVLSKLFMEKLNAEFNGRLETAISIFEGSYHKAFLHELVSSQLDMDRLDYLIRDSYFTGVAEGVIGYERIIKMLNVVDNHLVVEEKGIYSIEKFLVSRRIMYWQVYLHKTVLSAEQMLISVLKQAKKIVKSNVKVIGSENLIDLLKTDFSLISNDLIIKDYLPRFAEVDDIDIMHLIKSNQRHEEFSFSYICKSIIERKLFKIYLRDNKIDKTIIEDISSQVEKDLKISSELAKSLILVGDESNLTYNSNKEEIRILQKNGEVRSLSEFHNDFVNSRVVTKYFVCFPNKESTHYI